MYISKQKKINKLRTGLAVDSYLLPISKSYDTKTGTKVKNPSSVSFIAP